MKSLTEYINESNELKYTFTVKCEDKAKDIKSKIDNIWDDNNIICKDSNKGVIFGCDNMGNMIKAIAFIRCYLSKTENPLTMDGNEEDMNDITYYIGKTNFGCVNVFSSKVEDEIKTVKANLK